MQRCVLAPCGEVRINYLDLTKSLEVLWSFCLAGSQAYQQYFSSYFWRGREVRLLNR